MGHSHIVVTFHVIYSVEIPPFSLIPVALIIPQKHWAFLWSVAQIGISLLLLLPSLPTFVNVKKLSAVTAD